MPAFAGAVDLGFGWLETDLHLTADGVVICLHDDTLDRTTNGAGPVWALPFDDVTALDAGHSHDPDHDFPFRGGDARVPSLEEVVTTFPEARLVVDLKQDGLAEPLWTVIERLGLHERLVVGSFSGRRLREFRRLSGGSVATSAGPARSVAAYVTAIAGRSPGVAHAVQLPVNAGPLRPVTMRTVAGYHRGGMQVHVWTVNDPAEMIRLLDAGVDALITDRPDLLREVLRARGQWGPG